MTDKNQWTVEKWQQELLNAEKSGRFTYDQLNPLWEKAKEAIESEEQAFSLYTTYIYMTRRYIDKQGSKDYTRVDELFKEAINFLAEGFDEYSETTAKLDKNYAYFLYTKMKKPEQARKIWKQLLEAETGPFAWLEAVTLERAYGDLEHARELLCMALEAVTFRPHDIYSAFVQFEREEGTREDLDRVLERINARVAEEAALANQHQYYRQKLDKLHGKDKKPRREQQFEKRDGKPRDQPRRQQPQGQGEKLQKRQSKEQQQKKQQSKQQQKPLEEENEELPMDERKMEIEEGNEGHQRKVEPAFQTSNVPLGPMIPGMPVPNMEEREKEQEENVVERDELKMPVTDIQNQPKKDEEMTEHDGESLTANTKKRKRQGNSSEKSFPYAMGLEKNKLFVKQLHFGCKESELKEFFGKFGKLLDVRILTKWNGKSKGCAYVDFETNEDAATALVRADGAEIRGQKIAVFLSNPPAKKPRIESTADKTAGEQNDGRKNSTRPEAFNRQSTSAQPSSILGGGKLAMFAAPRTLTAPDQRAGRAGRLMLPRSISKTTTSAVNGNGTSNIQSSFSPIGQVTQYTEVMNLGQRNNNGTTTTESGNVKNPPELQ